MRAVLGIDAAWTSKQPSGVAAIVEVASGWHVNAVASSYQHFCALPERREDSENRPTGSIPDISALLESASRLCGQPIDIVAVDMPLAVSPIVGRRVADNAVSKAYGGRKCGTHSPTRSRPGSISTNLTREFDQAGYPLLTKAATLPGIIEVYPHPALVELADADERLPYKAGKTKAYWPSDTLSDRRALLRRQWEKIVELLDEEISGVSEALPKVDPDTTGFRLKMFEDALDAIICAWVGTCYLEGRAVPYGDRHAAIWIPSPRKTGRR